MNSLWNDSEAAQAANLLEQRVYTSRLLGRDSSLVLHGGGNTSVKVREANVFGDVEEVLYVKGSGWDLETIQSAGFSPVRMAPLLRLATLPALSDLEMANQLRLSMTNASAPSPSVEAILHALLPFTFVDHTHTDAVISITNTADGEARIREIYGNTVIVVPYVMPGFKLARLCADLIPQQMTAQTVGMVLLKHGIFSFGNTARESYERMIALVSQAEAYLQARGAWQTAVPMMKLSGDPLRHELAALRRDLSDAAGFPMIATMHRDGETVSFASQNSSASQRGPATPDHVIRTKRVPMVGRDVSAYREAYQTYFAAHASRSDLPLTILDAAPRVVLDSTFGLVTAGRTVKDASAAADIYRHTMQIIRRAEALGGWDALPPEDIFDVEYWELEQAKLRAAGAPPPFSGEIALVTGAASGIGKACVDSLLKRGAAVVGLDINPAIETLYTRADFLGVRCDVTDEETVAYAVEQTAQAFGGLDMLVLNAGIFPPSTRIDALRLADWDRVMRINLDSNVLIMREAYPLLKLAPRGGRVAIVGSKNVPAPGPGQAAYSAAKAALNQLARVAALEWGTDRIRVNVVHPNAVFDTALWTPEVLEARAKNYGMTVEQYKTNNVMKVEVTSRDVGEMVAEMCGAVFAKTTGAQVPIDGGNDRVI